MWTPCRNRASMRMCTSVQTEKRRNWSFPRPVLWKRTLSFHLVVISRIFPQLRDSRNLHYGRITAGQGQTVRMMHASEADIPSHCERKLAKFNTDTVNAVFVRSKNTSEVLLPAGRRFRECKIVFTQWNLEFAVRGTLIPLSTSLHFIRSTSKISFFRRFLSDKGNSCDTFSWKWRWKHTCQPPFFLNSHFFSPTSHSEPAHLSLSLKEPYVCARTFYMSFFSVSLGRSHYHLAGLRFLLS